MRLMDGPQILSKFRGSILGTLVGDCCGAPFEGQSLLRGGERLLLRKNLDRLEGPFFSAPEKAYSDDTVMTRSVARTLIDHNGINQTELCKNFVREYLREPYRGYGEGVVTVFRKLRQTRFSNVLVPAQEQFGGSGSFGNGGAMRVAPVALFCHNKSVNELIHMATDSAVITHTHSQGVNGSILQALVVNAALLSNPKEPLDAATLLQSLHAKMLELETKDTDEFEPVNTTPFSNQLKIIEDLLAKNPSEVEVINRLGTQVAALYSVPTAIYCFLRAQTVIPGIASNNPFRRAIEYAISLGGDTDTIASMTGAISGAFYGDDIIPENLRRHCENNVELTQLADDLYAATSSDLK